MSKFRVPLAIASALADFKIGYPSLNFLTWRLTGRNCTAVIVQNIFIAANAKRTGKAFASTKTSNSIAALLDGVLRC